MTEVGLPVGWTRTPLGSTGTWRGGGTPSKSEPEYWEHGHIPWVSAKDMKSLVIVDTSDHITEAAVAGSSTARVSAGSILFVTRSGILRHTLPVALTAVEVTINQDLKSLSPNPDYDAKYLLYACLADAETIRRSCQKSGTTVESIDFKRLQSHEIAVPPTMDDQRRIVARIEELMSDIDAGSKQVEDAAQRCGVASSAVLNHFVLAGASGREHGVLPTLPAAWKWQRMKDACSVIQDGSHFSPQLRFSAPGEGRFPYVTSKNIRPWGMDLSDLEYVDAEFHSAVWARCQPELGDVLMVKDGVKTGTVAINSLKEQFSLLSSVALLKPKVGVLEPRYLKFYLQSPYGFRSVTGAMTGTAIKRIVLATIRNSWVPVPPLDEQVAISDRISTELSLIEATRDTLNAARLQATSMRQSVLKSAFNGQLV